MVLQSLKLNSIQLSPCLPRWGKSLVITVFPLDVVPSVFGHGQEEAAAPLLLTGLGENDALLSADLRKGGHGEAVQ